jgi:hypothetical protein
MRPDELKSRGRQAALLPMLALATISVVACGRVTKADKYVALEDPNERIDVVLASVLPPSGSGWMQFREHEGKVHLGKLGAASGQSFSGLVVLTRLPTLKSKEEFFELVSKQRARDSDDPRFEDLVKDEATSVEDGAWAFRFHVRYKDLGANDLYAGLAGSPVNQLPVNPARHKPVTTYGQLRMSRQIKPER